MTDTTSEKELLTLQEYPSSPNHHPDHLVGFGLLNL